MKKRQFLTNVLTMGIGITISPFLINNRDVKLKFGYLSVFNLPAGTFPGDWSLIDNKTDKFYKINDRESPICDGKPVYEFYPQIINDKTGYIEGFVCKYENCCENISPHDGFKYYKNGLLIYRRDHKIYNADFRIKYWGSIEKYKCYC